jgi:phage-related protein
MGMIFKGLTFGGINSLDYGIFITGEAVYNAPERSVTSIEIEGRNGDLLIDNGRFLNIEIKYPAGCFAETQEDFKQKIESFRNAIISQISYQRLTDDYNPDEYRFAVYKSGLDVSVAVLHQGGEFDLTFDCKPQRFLTSGETEKKIPEWSDLHTDSGSLVTVDNSSGEYAVKSLSAAIVPQQDLNGYDHPWPAGGGKNLFPEKTLSLGKPAARTKEIYFDIPIPAGEYVMSFTKGGTHTGGWGIGLYAGSTSVGTVNVNTGKVIINDTATRAYIYMSQAGYDDGLTLELDNIQLELGSTATAYTPYENICPITGVTGANIYVQPLSGNGAIYNVQFANAGTVYGGTLDVVSGQLTVTHKIISENDFYAVSSGTSGGGLHYANVNSSGYPAATSSNSLSNMLVNNQSGWGSTTPCYTTNTSGNPVRVYGVFTTLEEFKTAYAGLQIVYEFATPLTYQLTATQVAFLLGANNIWSDTGDISIEYGKGGNTLYNPTLFDSRPLIELTGAGTLGINNYLITITGSGKLYIDCYTMEAYTITGGIVTSANNRVSLNTTDYPVLRSGINSFAVGTGISNVKITPRWWRV